MNLSWEDQIKKGNVRKTISNKGRIIALINFSDNCFKIFSKIPLNDQNSSIIFTNFYEALREICEAVSLSKGYKIYTHEAIALFLKEILKEDAIFSKFDRFRMMRNGVNYYAKPVLMEETLSAIGDIEKIINQLKIKYLSKFI